MSLVGGVIGGLAISTAIPPTKNQLIEEFYRIENAVHVSPHSVRTHIMEGKNDVTIVDLRSTEEYEREHIVGAVSIPAYSDPDTSAYGEVDRIVSAFKALPQEKPIVVYCYSIPCMTGRKIGLVLAERGIHVQHLGIGWNEWRHFWQLWNHEHEWEATDVTDYIASGKEPGIYNGPTRIAPCTEGEFGC